MTDRQGRAEADKKTNMHQTQHRYIPRERNSVRKSDRNSHRLALRENRGRRWEIVRDTGRQREIYTDRQAEIQRDRQSGTYMQVNRHTETDGHTYSQTKREKERQR